MRKIGILILLAVLILIAATYKKPAPYANVVPAYTDGTILLAGRGISFELADDAASQFKGLSDRDSLEENQSMLFTFPNADFHSFWMKDMRFPIDIIWIKGAEVVDITENAANEPGVPDNNLKTYSPNKPADRVLELKSGWASRNGLKIGDLIEITQVVK